MQIERSATSISWIPSDSIPGPLRLPFEHGVMHYDPPPPLTITDLEGMRRRGQFRFANVMRAWINVETALTEAMLWESTVFGSHTPWGGHDQVPVVAPAESELERILSERVMQGGPHPAVREVRAGEFLFHQAEPGTAMAVILDGTFEVRVNDQAVGQVGPGTVVGERASLEGGRRTADLRALTEARVAEAAPDLFNTEQLSELARGHHREDVAVTT
jgi:hypothetical protein